MASARLALRDPTQALRTLDEGLREGGWNELPHYQQAALKLTRTKALIALQCIPEARAELDAVRALAPELGGWRDWAGEQITLLASQIDDPVER